MLKLLTRRIFIKLKLLFKKNCVNVKTSQNEPITAPKPPKSQTIIEVPREGEKIKIKEIKPPIITKIENSTDNSEYEVNICLLLQVKGVLKKGFLLPENFKLNEHINNYPPENHGFNSEIKFHNYKLLYILSLLSSIPALNTNLITEDGFVHINASLLKNNIKDYKQYFDYLINSGVIKSDNYYIVGIKSISYKWTESYENVPFTYHTYSADKISSIVGDFKNDLEIFQDLTYNESVEEIENEYEQNEIKDYEYLNHWYKQEKLRIDIEKAKRYALNLKEYKIKRPDLWDIKIKDGKKEKKYPPTQYTVALLNIYKIYNHNYNAHIDDNIHRLHSVITNIQKDYRNFITYDEKKLISIDIKNSQPYLTCILFKSEFWNGKSYLNLNQLPQNIQNLINFPNIPIMMGSFLSTQENGSFNKYIELVGSGKMYEFIIDVVNTTKGETIKREDAKEAMFSTIFSSNRGGNNNTMSWLKNVYKDEFNSVYNLFKLIKKDYKIKDEKKPHAKLACLLQAIESEIILHRCCKRIWEEGNKNVPIFTIHDSIITTKEHEDFVKRIMFEELNKCIGVSPNFNIDNWDESELKHPDLLTQAQHN